MKEVFIAIDGTEFDSKENCIQYEMSLNQKPKYPTREQLEKHYLRVEENKKIKDIMLNGMIKNQKYNLTDLMYELFDEILPITGKRITIQRFSALMRQLHLEDKIERVEISRSVYFVKIQ